MKKALTILAVTIVSLLVVVTVTAQDVVVFNTTGSHGVSARIDERCRNLPTTFRIDPGFTASGFKINHFRKGYDCYTGTKYYDTMKFEILGPGGGQVYYQRNHKDEITNVTGGPLSALVLNPGTYTLRIITGGRDASIGFEFTIP